MGPSSPYFFCNHSFVFLKCPHSNCKLLVSQKLHLAHFQNQTLTKPKPLDALNGLGCTLCKTQCLALLIFATRFPAGAPQARKTTPRVRTLATVSMTFSVNYGRSVRSAPFVNSLWVTICLLSPTHGAHGYSPRALVR